MQVTTMVANVSDVPGTSASGRAADDAATGTDGFLQELLGIVGMMPAITPPPAPAAGTAPAGTLATEMGDALSGSAKTTVDARQTIPSWLSTAVDEAASVTNSESATPNTIVDAASAAALPTAGVNAQPTLSAANSPTSFELPPVVTETQVPSSEAAAAAKSVAPPIETFRGVKEAQAPVSKDAKQTASSADAESSTPSARSIATGTDANEKTSSAAPAIDIDNLLASMSRFDKEHSGASKNGTGTAVPGAAATSAKSETDAASESATVLDVSIKLHAKPEKLVEEKLSQDKATDPKEGNAAVTQFSSLISNQVETGDTQEISSRQLSARLGTPEWKDQLGAQLNWMVDNGKHSASLKLTPENLGPVEVRIDVNQNQTSVWFSASNADTRTALEQALPRLRELMASNGMSLSDAGVFREPPRDQRGSSSGSQSSLPGAFGSRDSSEDAVAVVRRRTSLLDTYA